MTSLTQNVELTCYICGDNFLVLTKNKKEFLEKLEEKNGKILKIYDESLSVLPNNFSFCSLCIRTKKKLFQQEMRYYKKSKEDLQKDIIKKQKKDSANELKKTKSIEHDKNVIENYEKELGIIKDNLILSKTEKNKITKKIKELINHTEKFEEKNNNILKNINELEKEIYRAQNSLIEINEKQNFFDRRILFIQKFSILNQIFKIEIFENSSKINGLEIGSSGSQMNWQNTNSSLGNITMLLKYIIKKNNIKVNEIDIFYFGNNSYFENKSYQKKYNLFGPIDKENLDNFNSALKCLFNCVKLIKEFFEIFFHTKNIDLNLDQVFIDNNTVVDFSKICFKIGTHQIWTKEMKTIGLNLLLLIFYQEKKEELEFINEPYND